MWSFRRPEERCVVVALSSKGALCGGRFVVQRNVVWWSCSRPKERCVVVVVVVQRNAVWWSFCPKGVLCSGRFIVQEERCVVVVMILVL